MNTIQISIEYTRNVYMKFHFNQRRTNGIISKLNNLKLYIYINPCNTQYVSDGLIKNTL